MSQTTLGGDVRRPVPLEARPPVRAWDLTRILLGVTAIGGLIVASLWVVRPFLPAVIWATMIVVATWPLLRRIEAGLWRKRGLAVAVMTLGILAIVALPLTVAVATIVNRADDVAAWGRLLASRGLPGPPAWLASVPLAGPKLASEWENVASIPPGDLYTRIAPYTGDVARWLIGHAEALGVLLVQGLLTVAVAAILYARGETVAAGVLAFARRLAGAEGARVVVLSAGAVRAVALGIIVTAVVQSVLGGIGLLITGVPRPLLWTSVMVLLGIAHIGPAPVLLGAVIWLYGDGQTLWGTVMLVWGVVTAALDNVLRPILIRRGVDLPLLLVITGVIGGLLAFGLIGLFVGPVVLAVTYTLLVAWVSAGETPAEPAAPGA